MAQGSWDTEDIPDADLWITRGLLLGCTIKWTFEHLNHNNYRLIVYAPDRAFNINDDWPGRAMQRMVLYIQSRERAHGP